MEVSRHSPHQISERDYESEKTKKKKRGEEGEHENESENESERESWMKNRVDESEREREREREKWRALLPFYSFSTHCQVQHRISVCLCQDEKFLCEVRYFYEFYDGC